VVYETPIRGKGITLRPLTLADCEGGYHRWLNDPEINRFLESRHSAQTLEDAQRFVLDVRQSPDSYIFAVTRNGDGRHIGNIKIGPIHPRYNHAFIGYLIGERTEWGKGRATEAICLATGLCFGELGLNKVVAGVIAPNIGSIRALEKAGFRQEGRFREDVLIDGEYKDTYRYGILRKEFDGREG
jgi:RimJ/RimL family protein N-acetyltransferase